MISVTITGADAQQRAILALASMLPGKIADALYQEAELTMTTAKMLCPVVTGALRSSGIVQPAVIAGRTVSVTMGFGGSASKYALAVHENPRSGKTGGFSPSGRKYKRWSTVGQWKYLEQPVLERAPKLTANVYRRVFRG